MKILIIDDEQAILKMYSAAFEAEGDEVTTALEGETGFKFAQEQAPNIILLDIIMPRFNGLDVLKRLKEDNATKDIPVIVLTNLLEESSEEKAKTLGAAGYFVKAQTEPAAVVEMVKKVLKDASNPA